MGRFNRFQQAVHFTDEETLEMARFIAGLVKEGLNWESENYNGGWLIHVYY